MSRNKRVVKKVAKMYYLPIRLLLAKLSQPHLTLLTTKQLHAIIAKTHLSLDPFFATKLIRYYAKSGDHLSAHQLFVESPNRSIYLWNSIIRAYAQQYNFTTAFTLFNELLRSETRPDNYTYACIIRAYSENHDVVGVRLVHCVLLVSGLEMDLICTSALVTAYSKLGLVEDAYQVFCKVDDPDLGTWNSMINGYVCNGGWEKGMRLFSMMRNVGIKPDGYAVVGLLSALADPRLLEIGRGIHGFCIKSGLNVNEHVGSSLVSMYSRCSCLDSARGVFCSLSKPDIVTWSALITGFARCGDYRNALMFFRRRNMDGMKADPVLLANILMVTAQSAYLGPGSETHGYILRHGLESDVMVSSALVDMYAKCGFIDLAVEVLNSLPKRNIVTYNSAILGFGSHGNAAEAFRLFDEVLEEGFIPDESTFSALLHACCQAGLVKEGEEVFERMMNEFAIEPKNEHYVHMVKILGMGGKLEDAYKFVLSLSQPVDVGIWGALLASCEMHGNSGFAEKVLEHIFEVQPRNNSYSVQLSNIYANHGRWADVEKLRDGMTDSSSSSSGRKVAGLSWIGGSNL